MNRWCHGARSNLIKKFKLFKSRQQKFPYFSHHSDGDVMEREAITSFFLVNQEAER